MRRVADESLRLGHAGDVRDLTTLLASGVRAVVDIAAEEPPASLNRDLIYCRFPLVDGIGNPPWLLRLAIETSTALLRSNTVTFIYCSAGMSRSPCVAAAALSLVRGYSANEALARVLNAGPADVSPGLWIEIQAVLRSLRDEKSMV
ncbi:MAG: hypothetical protein NVSMB14_02090 [Isosphaeraceae bacterium]